LKRKFKISNGRSIEYILRIKVKKKKKKKKKKTTTKQKKKKKKKNLLTKQYTKVQLDLQFIYQNIYDQKSPSP